MYISSQGQFKAASHLNTVNVILLDFHLDFKTSVKIR